MSNTHFATNIVYVTSSVFQSVYIVYIPNTNYLHVMYFKSFGFKTFSKNFINMCEFIRILSVFCPNVICIYSDTYNFRLWVCIKYYFLRGNKFLHNLHHVIILYIYVCNYNATFKVRVFVVIPNTTFPKIMNRWM